MSFSNSRCKIQKLEFEKNFFFLFSWRWQRHVAKTGDDDQKLTGVSGSRRMVTKYEPLTTIGLTMGQKK
jgi:hypothetical protein